jgi:glycosyl hydrolase family 10
MKLKKLSIVLYLLVVAGALYAAGGSLKVVGVKGGFCDPAFGSTPENSPLANLGYAGAIGFPSRDRELGVELPTVMIVNRLIAELELRRKVSEMAKSGVDKDIKLYASKDNVKFHLVKSYKLNLKTFKRYSRNWVKIEITGFAVKARYLKLCPRKGIKAPSGLVRAGALKKTFTIYKEAQLLKITTPRFIDNKLKIMAKLDIRNYKITPKIVICLKIKDKWQAVAEKVLTTNGNVSLKIDEPLSKELAVGKYLLKLNLVNKRGDVIDSINSSFYHVKKFSNKAPGAGEIEILNPTKTGSLQGEWIVKTAHTKLGQAIKYAKATNSKCSYSVDLSGSKTYSVYVGLIGGDSIANVKIAGKTKAIRLKTWRKKLLKPVTAGEVFIGLHKGGDKLEISSTGKSLNLSHVRLQGLTIEQQQLVNSKAVIVPRVILHRDGFSGFYKGKMKNRAELVKVATRYQNEPLYTFDWCLGISTAFNIKTRRGVLFGEGKTKFRRKGDKKASQTVNDLYKNGINPLRVIAQTLQRKKVHVNATLRMNAVYPTRAGTTSNGPFVMDNPQYRIINSRGKRLWKLSYAYPEVKDFMLSVLEDAVACGVDGIHLQFMRHPPFFGVDKPLIAEYKKRYGSFDIKKDYMSKKWQKLQCEVMTSFIKRIRKMLDVQGLKNNKKLTLSVSFDFKNYYSQGLDVAAWVKSGWISVISPGYYLVGGKTFDLKPFVRMRQGTSCKIFPNLELTLLGTDPTPDSESGKVKIIYEYVSKDYGKKIFLEFYNQGANGLYPFNGGAHLIKAIANMKELKIWEEFEEPVIDWFSEIKQ